MLQNPRQKRLTGEPRLNAHDKHEIGRLEIRLDPRHIGIRIHRQPGCHPCLVNDLDQFRRRRNDLDVKRQVIRAGVSELLHERLRGRHHQVHVDERLRQRRAERPAHVRAHRQVGDKVPVHDIQVQKIRARLKDGLRLTPQPREVSRQDRRPDQRPGRRIRKQGLSRHGPYGPQKATRRLWSRRRAAYPIRLLDLGGPQSVPELVDTRLTAC